MALVVAPSALSSWTKTVIDALRARGADVDKVLAAAGFAPGSLADPNARHSNRSIAKLWHKAALEVGDPAFGLEASRFIHPGTFHALGYAVIASPTFEDALARIARYSRVVSDVADVQLELAADGARLTFVLRPGFEHGGEEAMDTIMSAIVRAARRLLGKTFAPKAVAMRRREPADSAPYLRVFGCPVTFASSKDELSFEPSSLAHPLPAANPELASHNDAAVREYLGRVANGSVVDRVRATMSGQLDRVSPHSVARAVGMSVRSLQRALNEQNTSYEQLLRELRRELSCTYLRQGRHPMAEIAFLLGYENPSAFARSFKRWTGLSPSEYAAKHK